MYISREHVQKSRKAIQVDITEQSLQNNAK